MQKRSKNNGYVSHLFNVLRRKSSEEKQKDSSLSLK
jgi:hypothetical protein